MDTDHAKHLQLGADLGSDDRTPLNPGAVDIVWKDATTVEQFRRDLEALSAEPPEVLKALADDRYAPGPPPPLEGDG